MKTKAIKRCIDNGSDVRDALEAQVELYAIEAELVAMKEALRYVHTHGTMLSKPGGACLTCHEKAEAALNES